MHGYKIVQENGRWLFQLIPSNNNNQCVGWSKPFNSQLECAQGVKQLRKLIEDNLIKSVDSPFVVFVKEGKYSYFEYCADGEMLFRSRKYDTTAKTVCNKRVQAIFDHIESYTSNQKD